MIPPPLRPSTLADRPAEARSAGVAAASRTWSPATRGSPRRSWPGARGRRPGRRRRPPLPAAPRAGRGRPAHHRLARGPGPPRAAAVVARARQPGAHPAPPAAHLPADARRARSGSNLGSRRLLVGALAAFPFAVHLAGRFQAERVVHVHAHFATHPAAAGATWCTGSPASRSASPPTAPTSTATSTCSPRRRAPPAFVVAISESNREVVLAACRTRPCGGPAGPGRRHPLRHRPPKRSRSARPGRGRRARCCGCVAVGTLHEVKGQAHLIEACRQARDQGTDVHLTLVGGGPDRAALEDQVAAAGLEDVVAFTGPVAQPIVRELLEGADLLAVPSVPTADGRREGLPVVIIEAMATGVPVVASDLSGIPEIVRHDDTGLLVEPGDVAGLAAAIVRIDQHPDQAAALQRARPTRWSPRSSTSTGPREDLARALRKRGPPDGRPVLALVCGGGPDLRGVPAHHARRAPGCGPRPSWPRTSPRRSRCSSPPTTRPDRSGGSSRACSALDYPPELAGDRGGVRRVHRRDAGGRGHRSRGCGSSSCPGWARRPRSTRAIAATSGEVIVFTDANSRLAPDALRQLVRPFADPGVGGVAGDQRYEAPDGAADGRGTADGRAPLLELRPGAEGGRERGRQRDRRHRRPLRRAPRAGGAGARRGHRRLHHLHRRDRAGQAPGVRRRRGGVRAGGRLGGRRVPPQGAGDDPRAPGRGPPPAAARPAPARLLRLPAGQPQGPAAPDGRAAAGAARRQRERRPAGAGRTRLALVGQLAVYGPGPVGARPARGAHRPQPPRRRRRLLLPGQRRRPRGRLERPVRAPHRAVGAGAGAEAVARVVVR